MPRKKKASSNKTIVRKRSQVYNSATGHFLIRDDETGKFIDVKKDGKPLKGVRKEKLTVYANPNIDKEIARKAEEAVIKIKNGASAEK